MPEIFLKMIRDFQRRSSVGANQSPHGHEFSEAIRIFDGVGDFPGLPYRTDFEIG